MEKAQQRLLAIRAVQPTPPEPTPIGRGVYEVAEKILAKSFKPHDDASLPECPTRTVQASQSDSREPSGRSVALAPVIAVFFALIFAASAVQGQLYENGTAIDNDNSPPVAYDLAATNSVLLTAPAGHRLHITGITVVLMTTVEPSNPPEHGSWGLLDAQGREVASGDSAFNPSNCTGPQWGRAYAYWTCSFQGVDVPHLPPAPYQLMIYGVTTRFPMWARWDENYGQRCHSLGCPSSAYTSLLGAAGAQTLDWFLPGDGGNAFSISGEVE